MHRLKSILNRSADPFLCPLTALLLLISSCSKDQTGEGQRAAAILGEAKQATLEMRSGDAREQLTAALMLDRKLGRELRMAEECELLARNYRSTAEFDSAFWYFDRSYDYYNSVAEKHAARRVRLDAARLHRQIGDEETAFRICADLLRIARAIGDAQGVTELSWEILPSFRVLDRPEEEIEVLTYLLNQATATPAPSMQAAVYLEWGRSHAYRGEFGESVEHYLHALTLADQSRDSILAVQALAGLAMAYVRQGKRTEAFQAFTDGLVKADRTPGSGTLREEMLTRVGNIYLLSREFVLAERFFNAALVSAVGRADKLMEGYLFLQIGHAKLGSTGSLEEAFKNYQIALDLFSGLSYDPGVSHAEASYGITLLNSGRLPEALTHLASAAERATSAGGIPGEADLPTECQETFYALNGMTIHDAYAEVLLLLGKYDEAFLEAEKRRGEELSEIFGTFSFDTGRYSTTAALWESQRYRLLQKGALRELARALSFASQDRFITSRLAESIAGYKKAAEEAAANLASEEADLRTLVKVGSMTIPQVQQRLPGRTALLRSIATTRSVFVFAIGPSEWTIQLSAIERDRLSRNINEYNSLLLDLSAQSQTGGNNPSGRTKAARINELSRTLYAAVIRPVAQFLRDYDRLVIVPDKELFPYHALRSSAAAGRSPYLIETARISYLPAAATLRLAGEPVIGSVDIVGLGHPGKSAWDVEYELRDIRAFHKATRLYFGTSATLQTLQKERGSILHLAAEFHFDPRWPGNSFVNLSGGQREEDVAPVQWGKMFSIPAFPTVILSDLAVHRDIPLTKPLLLLQQGSGSVIVTQYSTHRKTKKFFGELFYTEIVSGASSDQAYTEALRGMIDLEEYADPSIWAAFYRWGK